MITIRKPTHQDAVQLSSMLCNDDILRADLNLGADFKPDSIDVLKDLENWCESRNAVTYAVLLHNKTVVGTISLSHINSEEKAARIGYWIGSRYRSLGYCSRAFKLVVNEAVERGIAKLITTIAEDNIHSRRIWDKLGGYAAGKDKDRVIYELQCKAVLLPVE
ncbi:MAG: GNAT family N-acetyltransferase [Candidatus Sabulitectum sp.]|nr:GNAT family N-acetyltransferase [Candidatus Sabulitectum sp.]